MATALLSVQQGYKVAAWDISEKGVLKTKELAGENADSVVPIVCDIANEKAVREAMKKTQELGPVRMLVNNAGPVAIGTNAGFMEMTQAAFGMIHYVTEAFLEAVDDGEGSIVNISSVVGPIFGGGKAVVEYYGQLDADGISCGASRGCVVLCR